jgi:hypothetical protein
MTGIFYAKDFGERWFEPLPKDERNAWKHDLLWENEFHRVIVDEMTAHDLVSIHSAEVVEWAYQCKSDIGFDQIEDVAERYGKFVSYLSEHPCQDITWDSFLDVLGCDYSAEHFALVSKAEVPFDEEGDSIYASMVGERYYLRPRGWWNHFWRVAMLTTEAVPTRIIEAITRRLHS